MIINMIIKAKRKKSGTKNRVEEVILQQQLRDVATAIEGYYSNN